MPGRYSADPQALLIEAMSLGSRCVDGNAFVVGAPEEGEGEMGAVYLLRLPT